MYLRRIANEKLTPIRSFPLIRHAHHTSRVVSERGRNLVLEEPAPDALSALARLELAVAGLYDEALQVPVEGNVVVVPGRAERKEILARPGTGFAVELELEGSVGCVEGYGHCCGGGRGGGMKWRIDGRG